MIFEGLRKLEPVAPARAQTLPRANARDRNLSLDAVAEQAGVSKGGLLYHFPTKQALISAIIERYLSAAEGAAGIEDGAPIDGNTLAIALLRACRPPEKKSGKGWSFLAAIAEDPVLLEPIREHHRRIVERLRDAAQPEVALIAFLVVEGIRSLDLFDSNPLSDMECESLLGRLAEILRERGAAAAAEAGDVEA
jgi:AcrR family transcriptional regulator